MSATSPAARFQDHYAVLGVDTKATADTIHKAYSALAAKFHPRNSETRDQSKYEAVTRAFEVLSDPEARRAFDNQLPKLQPTSAHAFGGRRFFESINAENDRRLCILCLLYDRRRQNPASPTLLLRDMEAMVNFNFDSLQFSLWYLKQRALVITDDKSSLQITAEGMEYLESRVPDPSVIYALLKPVATSPPGETAQ